MTASRLTAALIMWSISWFAAATSGAVQLLRDHAGASEHAFRTEQGGVRLSWDLSKVGDKDAVTFTLQANSTGYMAIGFGGSMHHTDMVICWVDASGVPHAVDSYSSNHSAPRLDTSLGGSNDVEVLSGHLENGVMLVSFRRLLNTNDTFDSILPASGPFDVVFAWHNGAAGELVYHSKSHGHWMLDLGKKDGIPAGVFGDEERGVGSRTLVKIASVGTLVTLNIADGAGAAGTAGFPYGSVAGFADLGDGRAVILLSLLERNIINQEQDWRCSLEVHYPESLRNGTDAMASPRTTLLGKLKVAPAAQHDAARSAYLAKHPMSKMWIDFADFALYLLEPEDVYWVGGFGGSHYIGWISPSDYLRATPAEHLIVTAPRVVDFIVV